MKKAFGKFRREAKYAKKIGMKMIKAGIQAVRK